MVHKLETLTMDYSI